LVAEEFPDRETDLGVEQTIERYWRVYMNRRLWIGGLSIATWFGIGAEAYWDRVDTDQVERVAQDIAYLCRHFFSALPVLLCD
jgi:hypothetical protein